VDHLVYAAPELKAAVAAMEPRLGVRAGYGGKHTGRGTHNALISLGGDSYLELIAPDPEQPAPAEPRAFGLDTLREPGLVAWAMAVVDIEAAAEAARNDGYDPGPVVAMSRALPGGGELRWRLTLRRQPAGGGLVPFLIEWETASHPSATAPGGCRLAALSAEHPHPDSVAPMLAALRADLAVEEAARPALIATIEGPRGTVVLS
jgi:hypothetical protein